MIQQNPDEIDIEEVESEKEDSISTLPDYKIFTYPADLVLEVIYKRMKDGDIKIPDFQRQFVWKEAQATRLIESFLAGLPVPAIFLYTEPNSQKHLVIDGQQRLKSIYYFIEGYFGEEVGGKRKVFRLRHLNEKSEWYNQSFETLSEEDKRKLLNRVLRAFIVEQLDPKDETSIYHIFERLNTGGTLLTNQEIRNSIYHGKFNDLLKEVNSDENWRRIVGKTIPDPRQRDVELILRFFAFHYQFSSYEKPLKEFMNKFMVKNQKPNDEFIVQSDKIFRRTCEVVYESLGEKPFHISAGLNPSCFDSVMCAISKNINKVPPDIRRRFDTLIHDMTYYSLCRNATTDVKTVRQRFAYAEKALFW